MVVTNWDQKGLKSKKKICLLLWQFKKFIKKRCFITFETISDSICGLIQRYYYDPLRSTKMIKWEKSSLLVHPHYLAKVKWLVDPVPYTFYFLFFILWFVTVSSTSIPGGADLKSILMTCPKRWAQVAYASFERGIWENLASKTKIVHRDSKP